MVNNVEISRNIPSAPRVTFAPTALNISSKKPTPIFSTINNDLIGRHLQSMIKVKQENSDFNAISTDSDKENGILKYGNNKKLMSPVDIRLLHHLHVQFRNNADSSTDIWDLVAKNYNFLTYSNYSKEEIEKLWSKFPAMEKRKLMLESYSTVPEVDCEVPANKKAKKGKKTAIRSFDETSKEKLALGQANGGKSTADKWHATSSNVADVGTTTTISSSISIDNQRQPYDSSTGRNTKDKRLPSISPKASVSKQCAVNKINQYTQTDKDVNDLENLAKEELHLKIDILKLRLSFMEKQYVRQFGN